MEREKKYNDNNKLVNGDDDKVDERAAVDLEGEDFYISTPIVSNYYYRYKPQR